MTPFIELFTIKNTPLPPQTTTIVVNDAIAKSSLQDVNPSASSSYCYIAEAPTTPSCRASPPSAARPSSSIVVAHIESHSNQWGPVSHSLLFDLPLDFQLSLLVLRAPLQLTSHDCSPWTHLSYHNWRW